MIDELYALARLRELSRATAQIAAERHARAALAATAPSAAAPASASRESLCEATRPLVTA